MLPDVHQRCALVVKLDLDALLSVFRRVDFHFRNGGQLVFAELLDVDSRPSEFIDRQEVAVIRKADLRQLFQHALRGDGCLRGQMRLNFCNSVAHSRDRSKLRSFHRKRSRFTIAGINASVRLRIVHASCNGKRKRFSTHVFKNWHIGYSSLTKDSNPRSNISASMRHSVTFPSFRVIT